MKTRHMLLLIALALLLIAASRAPLIRSIEPEGDEMNNILLSLGSPAEIIARTPYDWVPGGFLLMGAWTGLVGLHPYVLRWLPLLAFLLGCAFTYRLMRRWRGPEAGLLALLAYGGLGLHLFFSTYLRGYIYPLALLPCGLWLTERYFYRPGWRRALPLALVMVAMFYTQLTSALAFGIFGLYTLLRFPRRLGGWALVGILALPLAIPEMLRQREVLGARLAATATIDLPRIDLALWELFENYAGSAAPLWAAFVLLSAVAAALALRRRPRALPALLLVWALAMPVVMYLLNPLLGFFSGRYAWWIAPGIALLAAWGLSALPRGRWLGAVVLAVLCFAPLPLERYRIIGAPMVATFTWWQQQYRAGDVVVRDPGMDCATAEHWELLTRVFFPQGMQFASVPGGAQRIWYVSRDGAQDPALAEAVRSGRTAGPFYGPWECLVRLYAGPPDSEGIAFANGMRFHGLEVVDAEGRPWARPLTLREGEPLRLRLWWSADAPPAGDYSAALHLFAPGGDLVAQSDGPPQVTTPEGAPAETSRWQPGTLYVEERTLSVPWTAHMGQYTVKLVVYGWWDGVRQSAPGSDSTGSLPLLTLQVAAW